MIDKTDIIDSQTAQKEFIKLRRKMDKIAEETPTSKVDEVFAEAFTKIYTDAILGNVVAQDYLGYIFKRGKQYLVPENIDLSMKWLILAGANGNNLSIDRLAIFLNYAYDEIVYLEDFGNMKARNNIDQYNYTHVLGRIVCEAIIDEMGINALEIIKEVPDTLLFNAQTMGAYDKARNTVLPTVVAYLRGLDPSVKKPVEKQKVQEASESKQEKQTQQDKKEETKTQKRKAIMSRVFKKKKQDNESK